MLKAVVIHVTSHYSGHLLVKAFTNSTIFQGPCSLFVLNMLIVTFVPVSQQMDYIILEGTISTLHLKSSFSLDSCNSNSQESLCSYKQQLTGANNNWLRQLYKYLIPLRLCRSSPSGHWYWMFNSPMRKGVNKHHKICTRQLISLKEKNKPTGKKVDIPRTGNEHKCLNSSKS